MLIIMFILMDKRMENIKTNEYDLSIYVRSHGNVSIGNVSAPTEIWVNTPYEISYDCYNNGGDDTVWGNIINLETGLVVPGTEWSDTLEQGNTTHRVEEMPPEVSGNKTLNLKIQVGYITE